MNSITFQPDSAPSYGDPNSNTTADILNSITQNFQSDAAPSYDDGGNLASTLLNSFMGNDGSTDGSGSGGAFDLSGLASGLGQAMSGMTADSFNLDVDLNVDFGN